MLTLSTIARLAGISLPTARKYLERSPGRIPTVGTGRSRRYPPEAVEAFKTLRKEAILRHGRPRRDGSPVRRNNLASSGD